MNIKALASKQMRLLFTTHCFALFIGVFLGAAFKGLMTLGLIGLVVAGAVWMYFQLKD